MVGSRVTLVARPASREPAELSVVVPAFDEQARLPKLLSSLKAHVDPSTTEILIVDDGSRDATVEVARREGDWAPRLRIIEHGTNRGKGAAVRTGVLASTGERIAFVDADDATDLAALGPMAAAVQGDVGAVFGSRHAPGSQVHGSPPIRGLMGRVFNHVVRAAAGTSISDTQCGAKVFWAPAARVVFADAEIDGFAFDVEVLRRLMAIDVGVVEYPVRWTYMSGTKIEPLTPLRMLRDIARIRLRPPTPTLTAVDGDNYDPEVAELALPLVPGTTPQPGEPFRVLVPDSADEPALRARLAEFDR